jgi:hypothetical protein
MPSAGQTYVDFNQKFFDEILKSAGVQQATKAAAERAANIARATAPVDTGAYRDGITLEEHDWKYRVGYLVVGHDPKTLLIESKTGNLARALKRAKA